MNRTTIALLTSAAMVLGSAATLSAQGKKGSAPKPSHVTSKPTTTKVSSPKPTSGPKAAAVSQTSKGPKAPKTTTTAKAPKGTTAKANTTKASKASPATKSAKVTDTSKATKVAKAEQGKPSKTEKSEKTSTTTTTTKSTTTTSGDSETPVTLTKVQEKLQKNTKLAEKLEGRLPKGTDLMEAADGFKNLGQFVAAVNVSNNLGLDFDKLKTAMVDDGKSLGQAIQSVKKDVESPTVVAQRAETDAAKLIQETEKQPSTTTSTTTTTTSTTTTKAKSKDKPKRTLRTESGS